MSGKGVEAELSELLTFRRLAIELVGGHHRATTETDIRFILLTKLLTT